MGVTHWGGRGRATPTNKLVAAVIAFNCRFVISRQWSNALTSGMLRDRNRRGPNVVAVIGLRQLMTETQRVTIGTNFVFLSNEWRVYGDADDVVTRRHDRLPVTTIQNKVLTG